MSGKLNGGERLEDVRLPCGFTGGDGSQTGPRGQAAEVGRKARTLRESGRASRSQGAVATLFPNTGVGARWRGR